MIVSLLLDKNYIADTDIYSVFINILCKYGNINEPLKGFNQFEFEVCALDTKTWNILLDTFHSVGRVIEVGRPNAPKIASTT